MKKNLLTLSILFVYGILNSQTFNCGDTLIDTRDGKKYATVLIGSQCWMKENLNYGQLVSSVNTGTPHPDVSNNSIVEKYCFNNSAANCDIYGGLYDWNELMNYTTNNGGQGICPTGWHIPSITEFSVLGTYVNNSANKLKKVGQGSGMGIGNNNSGFSALLGGDRGALGVFTGTNAVGIFWSSTQVNTNDAQHLYLIGVQDSIKYWTTLKTTGFSCRCVKNNTTGVDVKIEKQSSINIYPNPVKDIFAIVMTTNYEGAEYNLFSIIGDQVLNDKISSSTTKISTADLPSGLYILKVRSGSDVFEKKIIISK